MFDGLEKKKQNIDGPFSDISDKSFYKENEKLTSPEALERIKKDYWEKRSSTEYQKWEKRSQPVFEYLISLREGSIEQTEKVALICLGGGMSAAMSAGQLRGLELVGITPDLFKDTLDIYGISGGSGPAAYYASGETYKAALLFSEECTTKEFLNKMRVSKMIDTEFIAKAMRHGLKCLDIKNLQQFQGRVFAVAQNDDTGMNELLNLQTAIPDPVAALEASSAIPAFRFPVEVDGKKYIDGGFKTPPLKEMIKNSAARKVLVLPNTPFDHFGESGYGILGDIAVSVANTFGSLGAMKTLEAHFTALERFRVFLDSIEQETHAEIAILWPPDSGVSTVSNSKPDIDNAILRSARETIEKFGGEQADMKEIFGINTGEEIKKAT